MRILPALLTALLLPSLGQAEPLPAPVRALADRGLEIGGRFAAPGGLTGYVGRRNGEELAIYLTADGEQAIIGTMVDAFGRDLSAEHLRKHLPPPDLEPVWRALGGSGWIATGAQRPGRIVYAFIDPNCPYCHRLWEQARPYLGQGIQVRYVPVGIIAPQSFGQAARLLAAADPAAALAEHMRRAADGGLEPLQPVPPAVRRQLEANAQLLARLGQSITPTLFYRNRSGRVERIIGLPDEKALADVVFRAPDTAAGEEAGRQDRTAREGDQQ